MIMSRRSKSRRRRSVARKTYRPNLRFKRFLPRRSTWNIPIKYQKYVKLKKIQRVKKSHVSRETFKSKPFYTTITHRVSRYLRSNVRLDCRSRIKKADQVRRSNFFKSRGAGNSQRPEHNRKHNRSC